METSFEERLAEEVRKYRHLYDTSQREYKDFQKMNNSWKEISQTLGKDEAVCTAKWKYLRDRFVKAKRKMKGKSGDAIYTILSWLDSFVKFRETESNVPSEVSDVYDSSEIPFSLLVFFLLIMLKSYL